MSHLDPILWKVGVITTSQSQSRMSAVVMKVAILAEGAMKLL